MDFTLDFYLRQTWHDPRLAFGKLDLHGFERIKSLTVGVDYLDRLWKPDTFVGGLFFWRNFCSSTFQFPNEKKSFFHTATTHNSFLRIEPDGRVFLLNNKKLFVWTFSLMFSHRNQPSKTFCWSTKDLDLRLEVFPLTYNYSAQRYVYMPQSITSYEFIWPD